MWIYVILALPLTVLGTVWTRRDYRARGRLGIPAFLSLLAMLLVPHLALHDALDYAMPSPRRRGIGVAVAALGLALCVWGMLTFRSVAKIFTFGPGSLSTEGPYRWSRNPQYVGWSLFFLGFAVMGWTRECLFALGVYALVIHGLVLVEEEHLGRLFGEPYEAFRRAVPRYLGPRRGIGSPSSGPG